jgi:hypothetical protein
VRSSPSSTNVTRPAPDLYMLDKVVVHVLAAGHKAARFGRALLHPLT